MKFKDFIKIDSLIERGKRITNEQLYYNTGTIPVISSKIDAPLGYISEKFLNENISARQIINKNTFIYAIEGSAGFVSLYQPQIIWLSDVSGMFDVKEEYIKEYGKDLIAIFLQDFFVKHRHNNGTQPKFLIKNVLNIDLDLTPIDMLKNNIKIKDFLVNTNNDLIFNKIDISEITNQPILLQNFISNYIERGKRLVKGRELYYERGNIKAISSTTTGPMGYYSKNNYILGNNDFIYSIDGANAGYISLYKPQKVFITDHAGVITVKNDYVKKYGKLSIALFLQSYFTKLTSKGTQPTFILKNNLKIRLNLSLLEKISEVIKDDFLI